MPDAAVQDQGAVAAVTDTAAQADSQQDQTKTTDQTQGDQQQAAGEQAKATDKTQDKAASAPPEWRETITDPKLRAIADRVNSPTDLVKSIVDLRTDNSKRIKVPEEGAPEEDVAKYRKALGIPDKPDGYKITPPEGVELSEADKKVLDAMLPLAHKAGVPAKAMNDLVNGFLGQQRELQTKFVEDINKYNQESEASLKREWGKDFEPNLNLANRFAESSAKAAGVPEFKSFLENTLLATGGRLGDHPLMVKYLAGVGRRSSEGELSIGFSPQERSSVQEQITSLNNSVPPGSPAYLEASHQAKLQGLYDKLYGNDPVVGSSQRVA